MRVLYVDIDCLRNDHLGCYGYPRAISPTIDRIAAGGQRFENCYTANSPCTPSRTAFFSGRHGIETGVVTNRGNGGQLGTWGLCYPEGTTKREARDRFPILPQRLLAHGVRPVAFTNFLARHQCWWLAEGWQGLHQVNLKNGFDTADEVNAAVLPWLERNAVDDGWFCYLNYWDVHFPYRSGDMPALIEEVRTLGPRREWPDDATIARNHAGTMGSRTAREPWAYKGRGMADQYPWMPREIANRADHERMIDNYDATLLYTDRHLAQVVAALERAGVLDETMIVISGDHGDSFGEHGHYMDHTLGNDPVLRRPLVVRGPGIAARAEPRRELCYLGDLAATICDAFGASVPEGWSYRSLMPALRDEPGVGREYLVCDHGMSALQRSVRFDRYLAIGTLAMGNGTAVASNARDEDWTANDGREWWLYDLEADPHQTTDLAAERPDLIAHAETCIADWRRDHLAGAADEPDALERAAMVVAADDPDGGFVAELREHGREADARRLAAQRRKLAARWSGISASSRSCPG